MPPLVEPYAARDEAAWDALVAAGPMATFLHSRRFLGYHGDRFEDASVVVRDAKGGLAGVLPAALDPSDPQVAVSHPGATYGGIVHLGGLNGDRARDALEAICAHYAQRGLRALRYKPVPHVYHRSPSQDDLWALGELGAERTAWELSCAIDLAARRPPATRRARSLAKAARAGVAVDDDAGGLRTLWPVVEEALARRHGARPVHSVAEIEDLQARFPDRVLSVVARLDGDPVAGTVLFATDTVLHTQYLAAAEAGARVGALDAVIEHAIALARRRSARYFDLGPSSAGGSRGLLDGLYRYKTEFGGGGVIHEQYRLTMRG